MSAKDFSLAIGEIDDKYITEAISYQCQKKKLFLHFRRWTSVAACFILAAFLTGCAILTFSVEARAAFFGWVRQQYENFYEYFFEGEAVVTDPAKYELGWVPEGVIFVTSYETAGGEVFVYTDDKDTLIQFSYSSGEDNEKLFVDGVEYTEKQVAINGNPGTIYIPNDEAHTDGVVWTDTATNTLFFISGHFDEDTLIKMAESVKIATVPINYELGWMPEGCKYVNTIETDSGKIFIYTDSRDMLIRFSYDYPDNSWSLGVDGVQYIQKSVKVNGNSADLYIAPTEDETSSIIWTNENNDLFTISGPFDEDTLIRMAESVQEIE